MVAAEAAASGALPIVADHSGLAEVAATLAHDLPSEARELLRFAIGPQAIGDLAARVIAWLAMEREQQQAVRAALVGTARRLLGGTASPPG